MQKKNIKLNNILSDCATPSKVPKLIDLLCTANKDV